MFCPPQSVKSFLKHDVTCPSRQPRKVTSSIVQMREQEFGGAQGPSVGQQWVWASLQGPSRPSRPCLWVPSLAWPELGPGVHCWSGPCPSGLGPHPLPAFIAYVA